MSDLEVEFRGAVMTAKSEIEARIKVANAALSEAEAIAEGAGVPFTARFPFGRVDYEPHSFATKRDELEEVGIGALLEELDLSGNQYGAGWSTSSMSC